MKAEMNLPAKRMWLLGKKARWAKERREHADAAHNARVELDAVENELRELEKAEIKALKDA